MDAFRAQGYVCPTYKNPTDYFLKLVAHDEAVIAKLSEQHLLHWGTTKRLALETHESPSTEAALSALEIQLPGSGGGMDTDRSSVGWHRQTYHLIRRNLRAWRRHPMMLVGEGIQYTFLSLFVGAPCA